MALLEALVQRSGAATGQRAKGVCIERSRRAGEAQLYGQVRRTMASKNVEPGLVWRPCVVRVGAENVRLCREPFGAHAIVPGVYFRH